MCFVRNKNTTEKSCILAVEHDEMYFTADKSEMKNECYTNNENAVIDDGI